MTGGTLSGGDLPLPGAPVRPLSGRVSASVDAALRRGAPAVWTVAFEIFDSDLAVPALGETIRSAHAAGSFDGDRLEVADASGRWRSGTLRAEGAVSFAGRTFEGLRVTARSVPLADLSALAFPAAEGGPDLSGETDATVTLSGPFGAPEAEVSLSDADFVLGPVGFSGCAGSGRVSGDRIVVDRMAGAAAGGLFSLSGSAARADTAAWALDASGSATGLDLGAFDAGGEAGLAGRLSLDSFRLSGTTGRPVLDAALSWDGAAAAGVRLSSGSGSVALDGENLVGDLRADDGAYRVEGSVTGLLSRPAIDAEVVLTASPQTPRSASPACRSFPPRWTAASPFSACWTL